MGKGTLLLRTSDRDRSRKHRRILPQPSSRTDRTCGGKDSDTLTGNLGNDILFGDMASDSLIGGTGSDAFVLTAKGSSDIIAEFEDGSNKLALSGGLTFKQLSVTSNGSATLLSLTESGELFAALNNVPSTLIAAELAFTAGGA